MPVLRAQGRQKEREGLHRQLQAALHRLQAAAQGAAALVAAAGPESAAAAAELKPVLQRHCVRVAGGPALDALLAVLQVWLRLAVCPMSEEQCAALQSRGLRDHGITWSRGESPAACQASPPCCAAWRVDRAWVHLKVWLAVSADLTGPALRHSYTLQCNVPGQRVRLQAACQVDAAECRLHAG